MNSQLQTITCSGENNFQYMKALLDGICQPDFVVDNVIGSRCRKILRGKCCWTAYYRSINGDIETIATFKEAMSRLKSEKPYRSTVVAYGRLSSAGIFITFGNSLCTCTMDFDDDSTPFPISKLSTYNTKVMIINRNGCHANPDNRFEFDEDEDDVDDVVELSMISIKNQSAVTLVATAEIVLIAIEKSRHSSLHSEIVIEPQWLAYYKDNLDEKCLSAEIAADFDFVSTTVAGEVWCKDPLVLPVKLTTTDCMTIEAAVKSIGIMEADVIAVTPEKFYRLPTQQQKIDSNVGSVESSSYF